MFYLVCIRLDSKIFKRIIYEKIKIAFSLYFEKFKKKKKELMGITKCLQLCIKIRPKFQIKSLFYLLAFKIVKF